MGLDFVISDAFCVGKIYIIFYPIIMYNVVLKAGEREGFDIYSHKDMTAGRDGICLSF